MSTNAPDRTRRLAVTTVGALVTNRRGEALFVRSPKWGNAWAVPGGKVEWGESLHAALKRELLEETGMSIHGVFWAPTLEHLRSPTFTSDAHFVLLNFFARTDDVEVRLNDEATAHRWMRPAAALSHLSLNAPTRKLVLSYLATGGRGEVLVDPRAPHEPDAPSVAASVEARDR